MATLDHHGGGANIVLITLSVLIFLGAALSVAAFVFNDQGLTAVESAAAGFGGLAGLIIGLFSALVGVVLALVGAAIGIVAAGGVAAATLFIVASPIIAIVLIVLLMRTRRNGCSDPDAHH